MSRRHIRKWIALGVLLALAAPAGAATNLLRIGGPWPAGSPGMEILQAAGRQIALQTGGRVAVKFVEQLDPDAGPVRCDGALLAGPDLTGRSPAAILYSLPRLIRSAAEMDLLRSRRDAAIGADLEPRGFETLAVPDLGFAYLLARTPVESAAQFKGLRLWVPAEASASRRIFEAYGVTPVPMDVTQVRAALREGRVDTAILPPLGAIVLQWHVEVRSVSAEPFLALFAAVALRREAWTDMAAGDQAVVREQLAKAFQTACRSMAGQEAEALDVLMQNGVAQQPLGTTPEERDGWDAWAQATGDRLAAEGLVPATQLQEVRAALAEFRAGR